MKNIAFYGRHVSTEDLEDIYEYTYKPQMLDREENLGGWGVPQMLPLCGPVTSVSITQYGSATSPPFQ